MLQQRQGFTLNPQVVTFIEGGPVDILQDTGFNLPFPGCCRQTAQRGGKTGESFDAYARITVVGQDRLDACIQP